MTDDYGYEPDDYVEDKACPVCGGRILPDTDCPGYKRGDRVFICSPNCGNGEVYKCPRCDWAYFPAGTVRKGFSDIPPTEAGEFEL